MLLEPQNAHYSLYWVSQIQKDLLFQEQGLFHSATYTPEGMGTCIRFFYCRELLSYCLGAQVVLCTLEGTGQVPGVVTTGNYIDTALVFRWC